MARKKNGMTYMKYEKLLKHAIAFVLGALGFVLLWVGWHFYNDHGNLHLLIGWANTRTQRELDAQANVKPPAKVEEAKPRSRKGRKR